MQSYEIIDNWPLIIGIFFRQQQFFLFSLLTFHFISYLCIVKLTVCTLLLLLQFLTGTAATKMKYPGGPQYMYCLTLTYPMALSKVCRTAPPTGLAARLYRPARIA